ncbi:MAG: AAA family ATPase [Nitrosarchaeum sp.]|nr:AAA family ATPase [Nitrosarchaeum sp.]
MFVIIEGLHNTGKSTLSTALQQQGFLLFECRRNVKQLLNARNSQISDFALGVNSSILWFAKSFAASQNVLFDRLHFSEYAYGQIFRNVNRYDAISQFKLIDSKLSECNVKLIYLFCDYETMIERLQTKNQIYTATDYKKLAEFFSEAFDSSLLTSKIINTTTSNQIETLQIATDFLKE